MTDALNILIQSAEIHLHSSSRLELQESGNCSMIISPWSLLVIITTETDYQICSQIPQTVLNIHFAKQFERIGCSKFLKLMVTARLTKMILPIYDLFPPKCSTHQILNYPTSSQGVFCQPENYKNKWYGLLQWFLIEHSLSIRLRKIQQEANRRVSDSEGSWQQKYISFFYDIYRYISQEEPTKLAKSHNYCLNRYSPLHSNYCWPW